MTQFSSDSTHLCTGNFESQHTYAGMPRASYTYKGVVDNEGKMLIYHQCSLQTLKAPNCSTYTYRTIDLRNRCGLIINHLLHGVIQSSNLRVVWDYSINSDIILIYSHLTRTEAELPDWTVLLKFYSTLCSKILKLKTASLPGVFELLCVAPTNQGSHKFG